MSSVKGVKIPSELKVFRIASGERVTRLALRVVKRERKRAKQDQQKFKFIKELASKTGERHYVVVKHKTKRHGWVKTVWSFVVEKPKPQKRPEEGGQMREKQPRRFPRLIMRFPRLAEDEKGRGKSGKGGKQKRHRKERPK